MARKKNTSVSSPVKDLDSSSNARKKELILQTAIHLFLENGYDNTSLRQIAEASNTSASLIIYHYGTKQAIAVEYLTKKLQTIKNLVKEKVDLRAEPELFCCTIVRLNQLIMSSDVLCKFYHDVIEAGVFRNFFFSYDNEINVSDLILAKRQIKLSSELYPFYSHFIIPSIELSAWLSSGDTAPAEEKLDVPFRALMGLLYVPEEEVSEYCRRGKIIADEILTEHPEVADR